MSCCRRFNPLISGPFQPFLLQRFTKSRGLYPLRPAVIFPVLGQVMGQRVIFLKTCVAMKQRIVQPMYKNSKRPDDLLSAEVGFWKVMCGKVACILLAVAVQINYC